MKGLARALLIACGTLCVAMAVLGVFLPVLPTTPFLLLAAFCYARSSPPFYNWLMTNRWFGTSIRHYREGRGIPLRPKALSLILLWLTIGYAAGFVVPPLWGKILLVAIAVAVTWHLVTVKTYQPDGQTPGGAGEGHPAGKDSPLSLKEPGGHRPQAEPLRHRRGVKEG